MKKILALTVGMLLIPFTAFGMQTMNVDEMAEITGQAGVAIALDDVKVFYGSGETWYQTAANWDAISGETQKYHGAVGIVSGSEMFYANAVIPTDTGVNGAQLGELESPGDRRAFGDYETFAEDGFNFGNTGYLGTVTAANNTEWDELRTDDTLGTLLGAIFGADLVNASFNDALEMYGLEEGDSLPLDLTDVAYDPRALTIRVRDRLDTFSDATYKRLDGLATLWGADNALGDVAANFEASDSFYTGSSVYQNNYLNNFIAGNYGEENVKVAGVEIGLPTVELYTESSEMEIMVYAARNDDPADAGNPVLDRVEFDGANGGTATAWSFGKIYTGDDLTLVLDGKIEITPIEQYANPVID